MEGLPIITITNCIKKIDSVILIEQQNLFQQVILVNFIIVHPLCVFRVCFVFVFEIRKIIFSIKIGSGGSGYTRSVQ